MSAAWWGAGLGALLGLGAALAFVAWWSARRADLDARVRRFAPDLVAPSAGVPGTSQHGPDRPGTWQLLMGPALHRGALRLDRVVGGSASVQRRIERAGLDLDVTQFRVQQATWGVVALGVGTAGALAGAWLSPERTVPLLILAGLAGVGGVMARDHRLSAAVRAHEEQSLAEMPTVAELLALAVAAGEGPVAAMERVVARSRGSFSSDLARVLAEVRTGMPVATAFDGLARRTGLPVVARFADAVSVAVERGTPLADVLHAQAADVREAGRRALIETGARREVAMMVPVVFLVLPTTVMFAFWPGIVGLRLVT